MSSKKNPRIKVPKAAKEIPAFSPSDPPAAKEAGQKGKLDKIDKKLAGIEQQIAADQPGGQPAAAVPGAADKPADQPENKLEVSSSGVFKVIYLALCDRLCDLTGKERFTKEQKQELLVEIGTELDALDVKWVAPLIGGDRPEVRILTKTGLMWFELKDKPAAAPAQEHSAP